MSKCEMQIESRIFFRFFKILLTFIESLKAALIIMIAYLMASAKLAQPFENKCIFKKRSGRHNLCLGRHQQHFVSCIQLDT